jgi:hypothetical protein
MFNSVEEPSVIDVLQKALEGMDCTFVRISSDVLRLEQQGEWLNYAFYVTCQNEREVFITSSIPLNVEPKRRRRSLEKLRKLMNLIHQEPISGTFCHDFTTDGNDVVVWSYILRLTGNGLSDAEVLEETLDDARVEMDENYPSFQQVLLVMVSANEAYDYAIPPVYGHA